MPIRPAITIAISSDTEKIYQAALELKEEITQILHIKCQLTIIQFRSEQPQWLLSLSRGKFSPSRIPKVLPSVPSQTEGYWLVVSPEFAVIGSNSETGLVWGVSTFRQLIRANIKKDSIPCLNIQDWSSLRCHGFQDDITHGPSPKLETLKHGIRQAALLKMNFFTYYLEHQFAINSTYEESYQLLDDLYSEQAQIIESEFFNVSCDETFGLGTGPSKSLAEKIGVGGVYARHMKRIHDLLKKQI